MMFQFSLWNILCLFGCMNRDEALLAAVKEFADESHGSQMRKYAPERYIVHPVRVMQIVQKYTDDVAAHAAALLHDVLEDTPVTTHEMQQFLMRHMNALQTERTLGYVTELTDVYVSKNYPDKNRRQRKALEVKRLSAISPAAQTIKYADILDNSKEIITEDPDFAPVFLREVHNSLMACLLYTSPSPRD